MWTLFCSPSGRNNTKDISFTVAEDEAETCRAIFNENKDTLRFDHFDITTDIAKISTVGAGMATTPAWHRRCLKHCMRPTSISA